MIQKKIINKYSAFLLITLFSGVSAFAQKPTVERENGSIEVQTLAENLDHPWGITFLPDDRLIFTERAGTVRILEQKQTTGSDKIFEEGTNEPSAPLQGTPEVFNVGQGGMLDIALDPDFETSNQVYLTFSEPGADSTATTAFGRGVLDGNAINDFEILFRMEPMVEGPNHFGGRILFTDANNVILTLAERFKFDPAQDLSNHLGTVVRINKDGSAPTDNPFVDQPEARDEIFSYGHRNIEAAAIDPRTGNIWVAEMGPMGGDELNLVQAGENYGWPEVSWGKHYDGEDIPDPTTQPEFEDAKIVWTPTISPSGMIFYDGEMFPEWQNHAIIGGLTSSGLVIVRIDGEEAEEVERIPLAVRVRDVVQARDGSLIVITDEDNGKILRVKKI